MAEKVIFSFNFHTFLSLESRCRASDEQASVIVMALCAGGSI